MEHCSHCGESCKDETIYLEEMPFCCNGCKTVYELLHENDLSYYYELEKTPGVSPREFEHKFDFLDNEAIAEKLLEFRDGHTSVVSFLIPSIHCSSCIWVLENLNKLQPAVLASQVNFPEKTIRITFNSEKYSLKNLVKLLGRIGYEPYISLEDSKKKKRYIDRSLIYKLGVAGFAFGNIMFLSFPEYFEVSEFWLDRFKPMFRWLMFTFSVPVVFYSAQDYFISAVKGLRSKILNIDVPIALGIIVLFIRSTMEIVFDWGTGFFDSLTGLVFFLLVGKFFQQKTYSYLSFERDYKSYFPIAVTRLKKNSSEEIEEEQVEVYDVKQGDRILVRNNELLPVDAILIKGNALIDYSFVTGESELVTRKSGDKLFAGGKQQAGVLEVEVLKPVEQSYLTQLWSNEVFDADRQSPFQSFTDSISKRFTIAILTIAFVATLFWLLYDPYKAFNVFTAVLIVACPCAIALSAPFTLGNLLRIFGRMKFYVKEASVIEKMASIDTVVFDKTGTLTSGNGSSMTYEGIALTQEEEEILTSTLRASNHPLSRSLYEMLDVHNIKTLDAFEEHAGEGMTASVDNQLIKIGSYNFVSEGSGLDDRPFESIDKTAVHISSNNLYKGCYIFQNEYRDGMNEVMDQLSEDKELIVLSGDNDGDRERLSRLIPEGTKMYFNQKPEDKLRFIDSLQGKGKKVMMVGDGLNDAGALQQSEIGVAIAENVNVFTPACDGILDASMFGSMVDFFRLSKSGIRIIKWSFVLSLVYNVVGLGFAVTGHLAPVVAAILMPLSSISIVVFTTIATRFYGDRFLKK
ncbi:MAG: heavy metal translocating P-type ATPase metal-binding domain-containing protein [Bacteroidia bacterium]|nr:heavy metal translocating P-type ATPase metal-binding domain-containing protein [Bacteroidia bacterium]NNF31815.1 HAD-IC family P-type ATPase [Flavobacteriaceae bacterium]MBT8276244.1 heavy metal translocating P-type ATPase metal-binding domain-containing protein [Bacteroidia bacterium]NNJ81194.1 HAD-IC family P-type ATPase [Flavobacteriaceae bacterium]NNK53346.1 HAD-IC family P-type ATPase [Flavobacteriaceae bacterium]